ncbi:hypothetical protein KC19_8G078500 [Ceratodon purpureus]|uniref:TIR domain-containing protein n=1 Tax=Ceratodon purpureus TaxID=3225 RepID=A0A8T0H4J5_CERPU|nr:hypothetical protein KC19_8G078500 [Ceratodon purpureus]
MTRSCNLKEQRSHPDKHEQNEEQKVECSNAGHRGGDDTTGDKKRMGSKELQDKEEARRVLQRVSSSDASNMGMGGTKETVQARELHSNTHPVFGNLLKHDVFLNHRGPDLKKTFVSHLAAALRRAGRDPFLDAKSLVKGQHGLGSINEALNGVHVHVAVFSPGYAESKYCLNELCDMLESKKPLISVFYDVEPVNLRWIEVGPFAKAFEEHLKKGRTKDVVRWRAALSQAADITGFRLVDCDNDTVKLEEKIVAAILNALPAPSPLPIARHPVGLNESSAYVIDQFHKMGDKFLGVMGIHGMGGIGKTTLAREVYNYEQASFGSRCFLKDVKDFKGVGGMEILQMKMVTDLLHVHVKKKNWDFAHWFKKIQGHKVLLVIDDVSERQLFDDLIPDLNMLTPGSRILIASRERDILRSITMDIQEGLLYQVPELNPLDSLDLFLWCAFRRNSIDVVNASFHKWVEEVTSACCGLPLALEIMGGFLADKKNLPDDEKYWREATSALKKNGAIITSLQITYDGLKNDEDKHMFLDIACFMLGHPKKVAMEVWESSGDCGSACWSLSRLIDKCLVKVDVDGNLSMHDLLRNMGRNIVMQRASYKVELQSHIWDPSLAAKILQEKQGSTKLLALSVLGVDSDTACKAEHYAKLAELRYLLLDGYKVNGDFSSWSEDLRWLQWRYCPQEELPWSLKLPNLVVLDLANSDHLIRVWSENIELKFHLRELRMLILTAQQLHQTGAAAPTP